MTSPTSERLARLADAMTATLEAHPERGNERCIILLHDSDSDAGGLHAYGYQDDVDAREQLLNHIRAIYWDRGLMLLVTRPDELADILGVAP